MNVYLVTDGSRSATTYNKRKAIALAKTEPDAKIYKMPYGLYHYPACPGDITGGWDRPTFIAQSTLMFAEGRVL